jgi:WD40 repeat protein
MRSDIMYQKLVKDGSDDDRDMNNNSSEKNSLSSETITSSAAAHTGYVWDVLLLTCGKVASCSRDGTIKMWEQTCHEEAPVLRCVNTLRGHTRSPLSLAQLHPSGLLVSASRDRSIRVWDPSVWDPNHSSDEYKNLSSAVLPDAHDGAVLVVAAVSENGFLSGGADGKVLWWRYCRSDEKAGSRSDEKAGSSWRPTQLGSHDEIEGESGGGGRGGHWVRCMKVLSSNEIAVTGGEDGYVRVWSLHRAVDDIDFKAVRVDVDCGSPVLCIALIDHPVWSSDSAATIVAAGTLSGEVVLLSVCKKGNFIHRVNKVKCHDGAVRTLCVVNKQNLQATAPCLISGGEDRFLRLWSYCSLTSNLIIKSELRDHQDFVKCVAGINDSWFVSGSYDYNVCIRRISDLNHLV